MKSRSNLNQVEVDNVINSSLVCHIAMIDPEANPYLLPFNFGYYEGRLYIHCAPEGKKIKVWNNNPRVCVAFSTDYQMRIQHQDVACSYSMKYRSVLIYGHVNEIVNHEEKIRIMNVIMKKYSGRDNFTYNTPAINNVKVFEVIIERSDGRIYGY